MKGRLIHFALCNLIVVAVLAPANSVQAVQVLDSRDISAQVDRMQAKAAAENWLALVRSGQAARVKDEIDSLLESSKLTTASVEHRLYLFVMGLRNLPVDKMPAALLRRLADYQSEVFYWHPESRGTYRVPLFNVANVAEGTLNLMTQKRATKAALELLKQESTSFWSRFSKLKSATERAGFVAALKHAPLTALPPTDTGFIKTRLHGEDYSQAVKVLALRRTDAALARQVIRSGPSLAARQLIGELAHHFSADETFELLRDAANRDSLASVAVNQIGALAGHRRAARSWLIEQLGNHRHGASAAFALAELGDPALVQQVSKSLRLQSDDAALRNHLLFLHLSDSAVANAALREFVSSDDAPAHLRLEVKRWLAP